MKPLVVAHRGAPRRHPENTLDSFDAALALGCDGIELDVQLSRDGVPVVFHDRTLSRAGGGRRRVHALDLDELRRLDAGHRFAPEKRAYRIPTLERVLRRYAGKTRLLLEIKTREGGGAVVRQRELARMVARMARDELPRGSAWILCFDADLLHEAGDEVPALPRVLNVRPVALGLAAKLRRAAPAVVCTDVRGLTAGFGRRVARDGRPLWCFTCNTGAAIDRALAAGAEAILSDRCDWLAERLRARGLR